MFGHFTVLKDTLLYFVYYGVKTCFLQHRFSDFHYVNWKATRIASLFFNNNL